MCCITHHYNHCSRPEDSADFIRAECIIRNYPAINNTLQLAEMGLNGVINAFTDIYVIGSDAISGKLNTIYLSAFLLHISITF